MGFGSTALRMIDGIRVGIGDVPMPSAERRAFHAELEVAAAERMRAFSWFLLLLHLALLGRDLTLERQGLPPAEVRWSQWLFGLHVVMAVGAGLTLLLLRACGPGPARARVALGMVGFLLAWSGLVSGVDQLVGVGITLFLIINLACALFVTLGRSGTAGAFALGLAAFVLGQVWFAPRPAVAFSQAVNGAALACTCWLFSRLLYASKARDFMQRRTIARQHAELQEERARSERVLYAVLPPRIVERLRRGEGPIADVHPELTILFADLTGFTLLAAELPARAMVELLNELFSRFDEIVAQHRLEKIKTVGDAYLAVRGLETPSDDDVAATADAALAFQEAVLQVARSRNRALSLRVGIARGVAMAGVLGRERLQYDLWGDSVNLASRLETAAAPGEILIADQLTPCLERTHELSPVTVRELKGKGPTPTRTILRARTSALPEAHRRPA